MLLSIIIPVYNVEAYLTECLDSVFNQFVDGCEVIAVNDGSTDNSRQILIEYQIKYPQLIVIDQENRGLSAARNIGMAQATGEYLYFLDSDDYLLPNAINTILNAIDNAMTEVIGFNATVNVNSSYITSFKVSDKPKTGIDYFVDFYINNRIYPPFNVWIYTYKRAFIENKKHDFKEGINHEDVLFTMLTFYFSKSIISYNYPIVNYRQQREGSICTDLKIKNLIDRSQVCRELDCFFKVNNFSNISFYNVLFQQYRYNLDLAVSNNFIEKKEFFFNASDKAIMKNGITDQYEFKLWVLASIDLKLMHAYTHNVINKNLQRIINIVFTIIQKCFNKSI